MFRSNVSPAGSGLRERLPLRALVGSFAQPVSGGSYGMAERTASPTVQTARCATGLTEGRMQAVARGLRPVSKD